MKPFLVRWTYDLDDDDTNDWHTIQAHDAEHAAGLFVEREHSKDNGILGDFLSTVDVDVKSTDGEIENFLVTAQLCWSYSARALPGIQ